MDAMVPELSDSNAASKAAALKLLENVRELLSVPTDHAGAKWNSTEPLTINKMDNMQKFIHSLVITAPAVHNVYSRIISSSVVTTAPLESAFSIAGMVKTKRNTNLGSAVFADRMVMRGNKRFFEGVGESYLDAALSGHGAGGGGGVADTIMLM